MGSNDNVYGTVNHEATPRVVSAIESSNSFRVPLEVNGTVVGQLVLGTTITRADNERYIQHHFGAICGACNEPVSMTVVDVELSMLGKTETAMRQHLSYCKTKAAAVR